MLRFLLCSYLLKSEACTKTIEASTSFLWQICTTLSVTVVIIFEKEQFLGHPGVVRFRICRMVSLCPTQCHLHAASISFHFISPRLSSPHHHAVLCLLILIPRATPLRDVHSEARPAYCRPRRHENCALICPFWFIATDPDNALSLSCTHCNRKCTYNVNAFTSEIIIDSKTACPNRKTGVGSWYCKEKNSGQLMFKAATLDVFLFFYSSM